ncbi:MAG: hypothetical protein RL662_593 [Bacteroidota bacterium]|jgi:hypothetical protein
MFEAITVQSGLLWVGLLVSLMIINEILRLSKWFSLLFFVIIPLILTFTLWSNLDPNNPTNDWFHWVKLYSVIAAGIGFSLMRYTKLGDNKYMKIFPVLILAVNILEAVLRDFELGSQVGGMQHWMNGVAGILSIITLCGWTGIFIDKKDKSDLLWADMTVFWIIAYDVWNFAYIYNCIPTSAFFGLAVLLACTIPCLLIKKGTWVQARAFTLTAWMMLLFTFPVYLQANATLPAEGTTGQLIVSFVSLALNVGFFVYHFGKIIRNKSYGFGQEIHTDTKGSQAIHAMEKGLVR